MTEGFSCFTGWTPFFYLRLDKIPKLYMDDLFHKILVYLYSVNGLNQDVDITPFLKDAFNNNTDSPEILRRIRKAVGHLQATKYVKIDHVPSWGDTITEIYRTLETDKPILQLELLGHNYIADRISKLNQDVLLSRQTGVAEKTGKSVVNTNDFTVTTVKKNDKLFWLTFGVAAVSTFATVRSCQISNELNNREMRRDTLITQLQSLKDTLIQKDSVRDAQQTTIDSLTQTLSRTKQATSITKPKLTKQ